QRVGCVQAGGRVQLERRVESWSCSWSRSGRGAAAGGAPSPVAGGGAVVGAEAGGAAGTGGCNCSVRRADTWRSCSALVKNRGAGAAGTAGGAGESAGGDAAVLPYLAANRCDRENTGAAGHAGGGELGTGHRPVRSE